MATTLIFECHFCKYKAKTQINLNTHYLFKHYFLNPDCSTDTDSVIENFMYSKDHFKRCIICGRGTKGLNETCSSDQLSNVRSLVNYFCGSCFDDYAKGKQAAINHDEQLSKWQRKEITSNLRKFYQAKKYHDAIWSYIQTLPPSKIKMYKKTLARLHFSNEITFSSYAALD